MDVGYVYENGEQISRNSHFFSPAYIQLGPGMLWKKSEQLYINIAPATIKLVVEGLLNKLQYGLSLAEIENVLLFILLVFSIFSNFIIFTTFSSFSP